MPRLLAGAPAGAPEEGRNYLLLDTGHVKIFYPARLIAKPFEDHIRIRLKKFLFLRWLELEGARSIVCAPAEE